ncbi:hypothetical protein LTR84_006164 [Exophiala bonariae]|uniref:Autophagy-related protein 29 n=1 Tax=Exophiala bonariae TaxID=1690606 RepID=A0AAV9N1Q6_9EURO|nr:hypothetical protein LTR84_006164 [Exophiala bonariae]
MDQPEHHFTVFVRMPYKRGTFVDPPPVVWNTTKEHALWDILSRMAKNSDTDWKSLAEQFEVSERFLLQQAAWLYERNLQQVRAHMRRVGNSRQSATPSPVPGSTSASMVGGQAMRRTESGGSRVPSRLSTQALGSPTVGGGDSTPGTPAKSRASLPFRNVPGSGNAGPPQIRAVSATARPLSRQSSKDADNAIGHASLQSRRGSIQHHISRSPGQPRTILQQQSQAQPQSSDSDEEMTQSRMLTRRPNPSSVNRRGLSLRKDLQSQRGIAASQEDSNTNAQHSISDDDDDDDSPSFLPFATPSTQPSNLDSKQRPSSSSQQDPSATLRGEFAQQPGPFQTQNARPGIHRRGTSERVSSPIVEPPTPRTAQDITSSTSSISSPTTETHPSTTATYVTARTHQSNVGSNVSRQAQATHAFNRTGNVNPLSPPHRALLPSSPRRHATGAGSDTSPSMGSSFSDLDDASVTQSALEEALLSGMGNTTMTMHGGVAGRVSGISQALRSRYFDSRGNGTGER